MTADVLLGAALTRAQLHRTSDVSATTYPQAARTYLPDGTGLAWIVPGDLLTAATFVVDAELPRPVRPSLARRYGVTDEIDFAQRWTRAEVLAKLVDVPIITWLSWHGLAVPETLEQHRQRGFVAWQTRTEGDAIVSFGVATPSLPGIVGAGR